MKKALTIDGNRRGTRNAPEINAALMELAEARGGILKAEDVVEAARPEGSPLHSRFEWDNGKAAEHWRYWQARSMIAVAVDVIPTKNANKVTRAFVSLSLDRSNEGGYRVMADVLSNDQLRKQLIDDAINQMAILRARFNSLEELGEVFNEMRRAEQKLSGKISEAPVEVNVKF